MVSVEKLAKGTYFEDAFKVSFKYDPTTVAKIKELAERRYLPEERAWEIPSHELPNLVEKLGIHNINSTSGVMDALKTKEIEDKREATQERLRDIKPVVDFDFTTTPLPHQIEAFNYGMERDELLIGDEQGLGKAVTVDTKVITPYGVKYMGDIHVGDKVVGADGKATNVIAEYPQGKKEIYRVTFSDGSVVDCCKEHLWAVFTNNDRRRNKEGFRVLSLEEIMQDYKLKHNYKYYIPMTAPVEFNKRVVTIPPYVMGALLGDGYIGGTEVSITTEDYEIINHINNDLGVEAFYYLASRGNAYSCRLSAINLRKLLSDYGLMGTHSADKFIPEDYLYTDLHSREMLLRGLLDTDGYIMECGTILYYTVSDRLYNGVKYLVNSLGGTVKHTIKEGKYKKGNKVISCKKCHVLTLQLPSGVLPFRLGRKLERYKPREKYFPIRMITNISYIGNKEAKCITVDNKQGLYLVNDFVVTHNTKESIDITVARKKDLCKCLIVCGVNSVKYNWEAEIKTHSKEKSVMLDQKTIPLRVKALNEWLRGAEYYAIINIESLRNEAIQDAIYLGIKDGFIGCIIVDEIHKAKNGSSQQGKALRMLKSPVKIGLSGTPMNKAEDLWNILTWLGIEKRSFYSFRNAYCIMGGYGGYKVVGHKNLESLNAELNKVMIRRKKEEVLDLPPKIHSTEYVELTTKQQKLYRDIKQGIVEDMENILQSVNPLSCTLRLRQLTGGMFTDDNPKLERIMDMLAEEIIPNGYKAIIFSQWEQIASLYNEALQEYNPVYIVGKVSPEDRQKEVERFQNDPNCKLAIGTIGAMGTGLTLNKASYVFFIDKLWNSGENSQAEDRAHRIGTAGTVNVISMVAKGSVDEGVEEYLLENKELFDRVVDGKGTKTDFKTILYKLLKL